MTWTTFRYDGIRSHEGQAIGQNYVSFGDFIDHSKFLMESLSLPPGVVPLDFLNVLGTSGASLKFLTRPGLN
jgi:hypothetical protein